MVGGLPAVALGVEKACQTIVRGSEIGLHPNCSSIGIFSLLDPALMFKRDGKIQPRSGVIGIEPPRFSKSPHRVVNAVYLRIGDTQGQKNLRVANRAQALLEDGDGFIKSIEPEQCLAKLAVGSGEKRIASAGFLVKGDRLLELAVNAVGFRQIQVKLGAGGFLPAQ
jgi:hypothetical protein